MGHAMAHEGKHLRLARTPPCLKPALLCAHQCCAAELLGETGCARIASSWMHEAPSSSLQAPSGAALGAHLGRCMHGRYVHPSALFASRHCSVIGAMAERLQTSGTGHVCLLCAPFLGTPLQYCLPSLLYGCCGVFFSVAPLGHLSLLAHCHGERRSMWRLS